MIDAAQTMKMLTAGDLGVVGVALDDLATTGDDATFDALSALIETECLMPHDAAEAVAYHIVHDLKRAI